MSDQLVQKVETGMWAKVRGSQPGQENFEEVFHFVASDQVDFAQNRVSIDSPLGQALSGAKAGNKGRPLAARARAAGVPAEASSAAAG